MHRIRFALSATLIIAANTLSSNADEPRSAHQTFVVRVPAKVSFETAVVPQPPTKKVPASSSIPASDKVETAFRLSGTSAAGITAWVEVQSKADSETGYLPVISLRIVEDERNQWTVTKQTGTEEAILKATSSGTGAATLVISSDSGPEETVIVTTIISRD
jgi:hypothetical protein